MVVAAVLNLAAVALIAFVVVYSMDDTFVGVILRYTLKTAKLEPNGTIPISIRLPRL